MAAVVHDPASLRLSVEEFKHFYQERSLFRRCTVDSVASPSLGALDRRALFESRKPVPKLRPGFVAGVFVDYFAIASASRNGALCSYHAVVRDFREAGLSLHDLVPPDSPDKPFFRLGLHLVGPEQKLW